MTDAELLLLKKGDRIGHVDCPHLLFEVNQVEFYEDDETGVKTDRVSGVWVKSLRGDGRDFLIDDDSHFSLGKIGPPSADPVRPSPSKISRDWEDNIRRMADKAFANHELQNGHDGRPGGCNSWRFGRPGDGSYWFRLTIWPGFLAITGDCGDCIWWRTYDMRDWAAGSIDSISYFAEKVPRSIPTTAFRSDVAKAWVWEEYTNRCEDVVTGEYVQPHRYGRQEEKADAAILAELEETRDDLIGRLEEYSEGAFAHHLYHNTHWIDGCDYPDFAVYNSNFLWCREAVRCGLRLLGYLPKTDRV
jgi:hypothetical protein